LNQCCAGVSDRLEGQVQEAGCPELEVGKKLRVILAVFVPPIREDGVVGEGPVKTCSLKAFDERVE